MYKLQNQYMAGEVIGQTIIRQNADGTVSSFLSDPANTDYQAFLKYQAEGGKVYGADEEVPDGQANQ
jgi:hypothetical protein